MQIVDEERMALTDVLKELAESGVTDPVSLADAAHQLNIHLPTLSKAASNGVIRSWQVSPQRRVCSLSEVRAALDGGKLRTKGPRGRPRKSGKQPP